MIRFFLANRVQTYEPPTTTRVTKAKYYRNTVVILMSPDGDNPPVTLAVYEWDGRWRQVTIKEYEIFYKIDDVMKKFLQVGENFILFGTGPAKDSGNQGSLIALVRDRRHRATFTEQILETDMTHYLTDLTVGTNMVGRVSEDHGYSQYTGNKFFEIWNYNGKELVSATTGAFYKEPDCNMAAISSYDNMIAYAQGFNDPYAKSLSICHVLVTRDSSGNVTRQDFKGSVETTGFDPATIFDVHFRVAPYYSIFLFPMSNPYNLSYNKLYVPGAVTHWDSKGNFVMDAVVAMDQSRDGQGATYEVNIDGVVTPDSAVVWIAGKTHRAEYSSGGDLYLNSAFTICYNPRTNSMEQDVREGYPSALASSSRILAPNAWGGLMKSGGYAHYYPFNPKISGWDSDAIDYDSSDTSNALTIETYFNMAFQIVVGCAGIIADMIVPVVGGAFVAVIAQMVQIEANALIEQYAQRSISAGAGAIGSYFVAPNIMRYRSPETGIWPEIMPSSYTPLRPPSFQKAEDERMKVQAPIPSLRGSDTTGAVGATGTTRVYGGYLGLGFSLNYGNYDFHYKHILLNGQKIKVSGTPNDHTFEGIGEYQFLTKNHEGTVMTLYATRLRDTIGPLATHPVGSVTVNVGGKIFKVNFSRDCLDDLGFITPTATGVCYPHTEVKNDSGQVEGERSFISNATRTQTDDEYVRYVNGDKQSVPKGSFYPVSMEGSPLFVASKGCLGEKFAIGIV